MKRYLMVLERWLVILLMTAAPVSCAEQPAPRLTFGNGLSLELPKGWIVEEGAQPPLVHVSQSGDKMTSISILREIPSELEVGSLLEYTEQKAAMLEQTFVDYEPRLAETATEVGEMKGRFFSGRATVEEVPCYILIFTLQGKSDYYLLFGLVRSGSPDSAQTELLEVMRSFREGMGS